MNRDKTIHIEKFGPHQQDTVMHTDGICRCICVGSHNNTSCYLKILEKDGRIRKMTSKEIGRLMGLKDDEIDKMLNCGISKSGVNNLFGNSIVVDVLAGVFQEMLLTDRKPKETPLF